MEKDQRFDAVQSSISEGDMERARAQVWAITEQDPRDPLILIKSASLLMVIEDGKGSAELLDRVIGVLPSQEEDRLSIATAMRGMGRPDASMQILDGLKLQSNKTQTERAMALQALGRHQEALDVIGAIHEPDLTLLLLKAEALADLGRIDDSMRELDDTIRTKGPVYQALVQKSNLYIRSDRHKEAVRFADSQVKGDKKNADMLALKAYVMRINGKTLAAVNYGHRALKLDHTHAGALETMAYCLLEKGKKTEAKIMAGAIFQKDPGNPAAFRILQSCL